MKPRHTSPGRLGARALLLGIIAWSGACTGDDVTTSPADLEFAQPQAIVLPGPGYDLVDNDDLTIRGARWISGISLKVGTGLINPFLSIQGNGSEEGFNTDGSFEYDQTRPNFTNKLPLNLVPTIKEDGSFWREVILDANEADNGDVAQFSIDLFELYLCPDADAPDYELYNEFTGGANGCVMIYQIDDPSTNDVERGFATDGKTNGSGNSLDYRILIPEGAFTGSGLDVAACPYAPANGDCGIYVILRSTMGAFGGDWVTGSTFEEFSTVKRPYVTVEKTANSSLTRTHQWSIDKSVDVDTWLMLRGESGTSNYTVDVGYEGTVDGNWAVEGEITITNPTKDPISIDGVTDEISGFGAVSVSCGVTFPYLLDGEDELVCTYSTSLPDGTNRVNTATVALTDLALNTATADVDFSEADVEEINAEVTITDTYEGDLGTLNMTGGTFNYSREFTCDEDDGTHPNTATIVETNQSDDEDVTVSCGHLTVAKTVNTALERTYQWTIDKTVSPASWDLFNGDSGTSEWKVAVDKVGQSDAQWSVSGVITVTNDGLRSLNVTSVTDVISGPIPATVDNCSVTLPHDLGVGESFTCDYSATVPDGTTRTNTATTYLGGPDAGESFSSNAETVDFAGATLQEVNASINVTDTNGMSWGPVSDDTEWTYEQTFTCGEDAGQHDNRATITETGQFDDASVTVTCRSLTVSKTANTSLTRTWDWSVEKDIDESAFVGGTYDSGTNTATIMIGGSLIVGWDVVLDASSIDSEWAVTGNITVDNGHPTRAATLTGVSDLISPAIVGTVDCPALTVPAGGSLVCTYSADLPDGTDRTNTATATLQNTSFDKLGAGSDNGTTDFESSAVDVAFAGATISEIDECVDVSDLLEQGGVEVGSQDLGTYCASEGLPKTFDVTFTFGGEGGIPLQCGLNTFDNFGKIVTNDTQTPDEDDSSININVLCGEGCTLTQGYWKTHNDSFWGGAPTDETWSDLPGGLAEETIFFLSGQTWFEVFWTAPKGNAYYNLAHQYMAAKLNVLAGADPSAVSAEIAAAEALFASYTPAQIAALKGNNELRKQFIELAGVLGSYNEGLIGPGHCTENTEETINEVFGGN